MSQQKDSDPEEYKRLHLEKEAHLKRIQQLNEENSRLKAEAVRWEFMNDLSTEFLSSSICDDIFSPPFWLVLFCHYIFTTLSFLFLKDQ